MVLVKIKFGDLNAERHTCACINYNTIKQEIFARRKILPISPISPAAHIGKIYSVKYFPCVNDYIEDAATFTVFKFREMFMQYKGNCLWRKLSRRLHILYELVILNLEIL